MDIVCERCGARLPADDVDLTTRLAKCRSCQAVFDFSPQLARPATAASSAALAVTARPVVPLPDGIAVVEDVTTEPREMSYRGSSPTAARLVLVRSWYTHQLLFMAFFCVLWDGFLIHWYALALGRGGGPNLLTVIFPLLHVAVGVGLTYLTIASFFNKTWFTVADGALSIRHGPVPWLGGRRLPVDAVRQLYCERSSRNATEDKDPSCTLSAVLRDGRKLELVKRLPPAHALYLEHRIEERLGIDPAPVAGEYVG